MPTPSRSAPAVRFDEACSQLAELLGGSFRRDVCDGASSSSSGLLSGTLQALSDGMRTHVWTLGRARAKLQSFVTLYDARTREEGFHALHDWDGVAGAVNPSSIPVDVLNFVVQHRGGDRPDRATPAILLDFYFLYLIALLSLRIWDEGDAAANLDRLDALLSLLQGSGGSGQRFAHDAATLMLIATSHYEAEERGFHALLDKVRRLPAAHQTAVAMGHAVAMGCHLRFGFEVTYRRDVGLMRADNLADYPWLSFSLLALLREYERRPEAGGDPGRGRRILEAIVNGLSADPGAYCDGLRRPEMWPVESEHAEFEVRLGRCREDLLHEAETLRPAEDAFSPLAFFFNFSQNVVKGIVIDSLMWGEPSAVSLNDMFSGAGASAEQSAARLKIARALAAYARSSPDRIRGRLRPVIVYDTQAGRMAVAETVRQLTTNN